jgi:hypothetical protein
VICEAKALNVWLEMGHCGEIWKADLQVHYTAWVGDCWTSWSLYIKSKAVQLYGNSFCFVLYA